MNVTRCADTNSFCKLRRYVLRSGGTWAKSVNSTIVVGSPDELAVMVIVEGNSEAGTSSALNTKTYHKQR